MLKILLMAEELLVQLAKVIKKYILQELPKNSVCYFFVCL